ncbi:MAG: PadR family transcriptional regulator [Acidobacteria bacterium]|nr:PadR family transcriptional regulator [Acidobacteriota bacterium]MDA1235731.1 PadR family transcriptional regulator [Acidobacteriota bacterium]
MGNRQRQRNELLPGSVDLLILKALLRGPRHGYAITKYIRDTSDEALSMGESSLYTALQRLLLTDWVRAEWGASENNRRARYYTLTAAGKKHLAAETRQFDDLVGAIQRVLHAT